MRFGNHPAGQLVCQWCRAVLVLLRRPADAGPLVQDAVVLCPNCDTTESGGCAPRWPEVQAQP